jgi:hypothetical protein
MLKLRLALASRWNAMDEMSEVKAENTSGLLA